MEKYFNHIKQSTLTSICFQFESTIDHPRILRNHGDYIIDLVDPLLEKTPTKICHKILYLANISYVNFIATNIKNWARYQIKLA